MKAILRFMLALGLICLLGSLSLAWVYQITEVPRRQTVEAAQKNAMRLLLPRETAHIRELAKDETAGTVIFHQAFDAAEHPIASIAVATGEEKGFGGPVTLLIGFDAAGKITGILVTSHTETPGLGTQATDRSETLSLWKVLSGKAKKNPMPANRFLDQFIGKNARPMTFGQDGVDSATGATYSSRAVLSGINAATGFWKKLHEEGRL